MNYFQHLLKNWSVAGHALKDFVCHFTHGLIPVIKIQHHEARLNNKGEIDLFTLILVMFSIVFILVISTVVYKIDRYMGDTLPFSVILFSIVCFFLMSVLIFIIIFDD